MKLFATKNRGELRNHMRGLNFFAFEEIRYQNIFLALIFLSTF